MSGPARAWSIGLRGVDGEVVEIEADIGNGLPAVSLVGLPDASLHESRDRVRAAVVNTGEPWPGKRITLALSPATLPKQGSGYDVALACAVLAAAGRVPAAALGDVVLLGELALDGRIRGIRGVLPCLLAARRAGMARAVVPYGCLEEASLVEGIDVLGATCLGDVLLWLRGGCGLVEPGPVDRRAAPRPEDLADVIGQREARRAVEIAAAGGHHLLLTGPPGVGKTMLARRMTGLLPDLDVDDATQVAAVRSLAGTLTGDEALPTRPPFVAPHHTATTPALVGGGSGLARPGAVSLAHRGVLFLDEVSEFAPQQLDTLRTPLEEGEIRLARKDGTVRYPARFQLVMAGNTCPCGAARVEACTCTPTRLRRYQARMSGPLLDRIDLCVTLRSITGVAWAGGPDDPGSAVAGDDGEVVALAGEDTATVRARVLAARAVASERWAGTGWRANADVPGPALRRLEPLPRDATALLERWVRAGRLTARGLDRTVRVAWTVADLAGAAGPDVAAVEEALTFRLAGVS